MLKIYLFHGVFYNISMHIVTYRSIMHQVYYYVMYLCMVINR